MKKFWRAARWFVIPFISVTMFLHLPEVYLMLTVTIASIAYAIHWKLKLKDALDAIKILHREKNICEQELNVLSKKIPALKGQITRLKNKLDAYTREHRTEKL
jgi:hypothetical protein